jgi:hypothetical protein
MAAAMDTNDKFSRQAGEDSGAHFARMARELWGCVDDLKRVALPAFERRMDGLERRLDKAHYDLDRDLAVRAEAEKATDVWRRDTRARLQRVEEQIDALRIAAGLPQSKASILELDLKTLVIAAVAIGAVIYGFFRQGIVP